MRGNFETVKRFGDCAYDEFSNASSIRCEIKNENSFLFCSTDVNIEIIRK